MTVRVTLKLASDFVRRRACQMIMEAPEGFIVAIGEETRSAEQNRLMWPLIKDIREQSEDMGRFAPDDVKLMFLHALGSEARWLPEIDGGGQFPVGQRSSTLTKAQFSMLIELMFHWGAKHGVKWSQKALDSYGQVAS